MTAESTRREEGTERLMRIKKFMEKEGFTKFHRAEIAFFDMLQKRNVEKVVISGFRNGTGGLVKIPESLLGRVDEAQLMFVKCNKNGFPTITEKFVLARARGLAIYDSSYLLAWADSAALPNLKLFPAMCEWSHGAGKSVTLQPIVDKFFEGQTFTFANTEHWRVSSASVATAIEFLGGRVVGWEERGSAHCNIISPEPVCSEVAIDPAWIANMLAVGQSLPSAKWRQEFKEEDDFVMSSQVAFALFLLSCVMKPLQAVCEVATEEKQLQHSPPDLVNKRAPAPTLQQPAPANIPAALPSTLPAGNLLNMLATNLMAPMLPPQPSIMALLQVWHDMA
jgi:hypothetical protein